MISDLGRRLFGWLKRWGRASTQPGAGDEKDVDWVLVLTVWNSAEAVMIISRLRDEGIRAIIGSEAASQSMPVTAGMLSEIEVLVPGPMEDRALKVLKDLGFLDEEDETDEEKEDT